MNHNDYLITLIVSDHWDAANAVAAADVYAKDNDGDVD